MWKPRVRVLPADRVSPCEELGRLKLAQGCVARQSRLQCVGRADGNTQSTGATDFCFHNHPLAGLQTTCLVGADNHASLALGAFFLKEFKDQRFFSARCIQVGKGHPLQVGQAGVPALFEPAVEAGERAIEPSQALL